MKHLFYLLLITLVLITCHRCTGGSNSHYDYSVRVVGVSDGDTFTGLTDNNEGRFMV